MLSWTLFTISTVSSISISRSLVSCNRDRSRRRAMASTSESTVPGSGGKRTTKMSVAAVFVRSTLRCARNSPRILAGTDCDSTAGEDAGRRRIYTTASLTVCNPPGALFCTVMRSLSSFAFPTSTEPLVDGASLTWTMK